jgi:hypothetical protein
MLSKEASEIREFWMPKNKINRVNERYIRKAMRASEVEEHSISYFLYISGYDKQHKNVLAALKA